MKSSKIYKKNYSGVFFDLGGTLLYPNPIKMGEIFQTIFSSVPKLDEWMRSIYETTDKVDKLIKTNGTLPQGWWTVYFSEIISRLNLPIKPEQKLCEKFCQQLADFHQKENLWSFKTEFADELLGELKSENYILGIISNSDGRVKEQIEQAGWIKFFDFILDSHIVGCEKPGNKIFELAFEKSGLSSKQALFIGDFENVDIAGAHNVGMDAVLFDPGDLSSGFSGKRITKLFDIKNFLE
ncbi:MAG: HAD-IA family hydrolase [Candidatus Riflebacteria bacterium]|nr:HAD-IA family hydrolase [Candidatus Riflebacteria bacterium]